jgi:Mg/Co/Ni transporter MgtE
MTQLNATTGGGAGPGMNESRERERDIERLATLIGRKAWAELRADLRHREAPDLAVLLTELGKKDRVLLFRMLPRPAASDVMARLEPQSRDELLRELTDGETRRLLADLSPDDRTELLSEIPGEATQRLLNLLGPDDLREARLLLGYPEDSVGRLMTPDYVAVRPEWTIARSLDHFRARGWSSRGGRELATVVAAAMLAIVVTTNLIGVLVPFLLAKLRIDPAVASSPLIASVSDVTCLTIYFFLAGRLLGA